MKDPANQPDWPEPLPAQPPGFVMWNELPEDGTCGWDRQWFGHELNPGAVFNVRGVGIREPLFNPDVHRPHGTGDWLIMFFHEPVRLNTSKRTPSHDARTIVIWPPKAEQFYSWGHTPNHEPHSWMHVEGSWVQRQIEAMDLPTDAPFHLPDDTVVIRYLEALLNEMREPTPDAVILRNLFENWARAIRRQIRPADAAAEIPAGLLRVREYLDADFRRIPPLDDLAEIAHMSRSHLCHRFREHFDSSISQYVIRKRMAAAERLLYQVELRPGDIAEAVGYPDIFQFSKQFKKSFGVSPTQYRKEHLPNSTS